MTNGILFDRAHEGARHDGPCGRKAMGFGPFDVDQAPAMASAISEIGSRSTRWSFRKPAAVGRWILEEGRRYRRWRPALAMGTGAPAFVQQFFLPPAPVPWLGFVCARNAITLGAGMTFAVDHALVGTGLMYHPSLFPHPDGGVPVAQGPAGDFEVSLPNNELYFSGVTCNLLSPGLESYGHWLVDCLPRLHLCMTTGVPVDRYLFPAPEHPFKLSLLEWMKLPREKIVFVDTARSAVRCETMILPTFLRFNSEIRPSLMDAFRGIQGASTADRSRRLFVSRSGWGGSRPLEERRQIEAVFASKNFEIVMPETMPLDDVISLFSRAAIVAGECGSGLHNTIFCPPGTRVGVIQNCSNGNYLPAQMAMWQNQEVWYLIGSESEGSGDDGRYSVDIGDAQRFADAISG
jgi:hypothetical protein